MEKQPGPGLQEPDGFFGRHLVDWEEIPEKKHFKILDIIV